MSEHPPLVRTRLSILMFFEFFIWGSWGFALAGYAGKTLHFSGNEFSWLVAIPAIGAIVSPLFMGVIADRFFAAQKLLTVLHTISGIGLLVASYQQSFTMLMLFMTIHGLCFFPTIALANSVAFTHIPDASKFPRIAVFGTIGWIVAVLLADGFLGGIDSSNFLFQAGIASIILAVYSITLPNTPPKGASEGGDAFGLSALKLLKDPQFMIFIGCVFLISIPACGYFFTLATPMLSQRGYPAPLSLTTLCQFSEIIFMFFMPVFVIKLGLKKTLLIGMVAWLVRYLLFIANDFSMDIIGLLLHGFCYSFLYVGAYMYVDKRAPADLKASAQSLLSFLLLGVAWFVGAKAGGIIMDMNPPEISNMPQYTVVTVEQLTDKEKADIAKKLEAGELLDKPRVVFKGELLEGIESPLVEYKATAEVKKDKLPEWKDPGQVDSKFSFLDLAEQVRKIRGVKPDFTEQEFLAQVDDNGDTKITLAELEKFDGDEIIVGKTGITEESKEKYKKRKSITTYQKADLITVFKKIAEKVESDDETLELERYNWLQVQGNNWFNIWLWPAIYIFVITVFFLVAFKEKENEDETETGETEEKPEETDGK